ncbi:serine/threonine-protein kinase [Oscillibacter sp. ER4]|uniref:serine/threonine-protein kinase n=1 Tax=Oscillibacter sp. ER4 TaxID=1519439 RepID=UPI00051C2FED|nr:serine/threonine-protein kinase [Oscillibacter sp. ER4]
MTLYESFLEAVTTEYDTLRVLKQSPRGTVSVVRHKKSGTCYVFRRYSGSGEVYRRLLPVLCPHLPQIMEAEQDGQTAVLEEYVQGDTLAELLMGARLTEREARQVTMQLCQALHVLHSMGAVHRDVKPENVILRGSDAVLIDFDAARIYKDESESDTQVLGTTGFAAPEQYGIFQSDERADIFSLGVLLNIMLTGKHPSREMAAGKMGRIVRKCTMTAPEQRYQSARALMEVL